MMATHPHQTPTSYETLFAENLRLKASARTGGKATLYVVSTIALCVLAAGFVLAITLIRPDKDNSALILTVTGIVVPVVTALLAMAVQEVHLAVNSRLSQLLELTAAAAKAEGKLDGAADNAVATHAHARATDAP